MDPVRAEKVPSLEGCRVAAGWVLGADSQHFVEHITALSFEGGKEHSDRGMSVSEASAYRNGLTGFGIRPWLHAGRLWPVGLFSGKWPSRIVFFIAGSARESRTGFL